MAATALTAHLPHTCLTLGLATRAHTCCTLAAHSLHTTLGCARLTLRLLGHARKGRAGRATRSHTPRRATGVSSAHSFHTWACRTHVLTRLPHRTLAASLLHTCSQHACYTFAARLLHTAPIAHSLHARCTRRANARGGTPAARRKARGDRAVARWSPDRPMPRAHSLSTPMRDRAMT